MEIVAVALLAVALGIAVSIALGNPLFFLVALIAGGLAANRAGYKHQGQAIRTQFDRGSAVPTRRRVDERMAELERLRSAGTIDDGEYVQARSRILADL